MTDKQSSSTVVVSREALSVTLRLLGIAEFELDDEFAKARKHVDELRAQLAAPVEQQGEPVAWVNDQQLLLCSRSPREDQPANPLMHNLPRNIAGSALRTDYCNTPLYRHSQPPAQPRITMADVMRAHESAARKPLMVGTSNWCAHMAEQLNTPQ